MYLVMGKVSMERNKESAKLKYAFGLVLLQLKANASSKDPTVFINDGDGKN